MRSWGPFRRWVALALAVGLVAAPVGAAVTCASTGTAPSPTGPGALRLRPADGGPQYYSKFAKSLPDDPSYFPIGVWFESVTSGADVASDKAAGLNLYVVLTANSNLPLISANGMKVIAQPEDWADRADGPGSEAIAGWVLADEIDMVQANATGAAQARQQLTSILNGLPADGRLRYNNYGKGVTFWNTDRQAGRYLNEFQDVVSADNYWFTDKGICARSEGGVLLATGRKRLTATQCHRAANYGRTVDRLRRLIRPVGSRPVWTFVEVGHPFENSSWPSIKPAELSAAVWSGLIHGARGVVYFNHSFGGPLPTQHALRHEAYAAVRAEVTKTNARIRRLAPVLNAPFVDALATTTSAIDLMAKYYDGKFYIFAGSRTGDKQRVRLRVPCTGDATVTVVDENRTLALSGGSFKDSFADGNAVHIYRIDGGSTCGLPAASHR